jgi:glycerophosphoryl diester phosphodiesterase
VVVPARPSTSYLHLGELSSARQPQRPVAVTGIIPLMTALLRVGHKGADLIEPGNTRASFDAALAHGVDMIELDVLPERGGDRRLLLAHDYEDAAKRVPLTLDEGLSHLASERFAGVGFIIDLKLPGYELAVLDGLQRHGLERRALVSTMFRDSLAVLRAADRAMRLGWSVPRVRRDYTKSPFLAVPALVALRGMRLVLPRRARAAIEGGVCDAVLAHWRLVSPALVKTVKRAGGELYVWTVDEAPRIQALRELGVTGVITNDPRLFEALA